MYLAYFSYSEAAYEAKLHQNEASLRTTQKKH